MSFYDLEYKTEQAFLSRLAAASIAGLNQYAGHNSAEMALPWCSVHARQGDEFPVGSANYRVHVEITVAGSADDGTPETTHKTFVGKVRDALLVATLPGDLSAAVADFTCPDAWAGPVETRVEDRRFLSTLEITIIAANADI